jgi:hypothetical protein
MTANVEEGIIGEVGSTKRLSIKMDPVSVLDKEVGPLVRNKRTRPVPRRRPGKPKPKPKPKTD